MQAARAAVRAREIQQTTLSGGDNRRRELSVVDDVDPFWSTSFSALPHSTFSEDAATADTAADPGAWTSPSLLLDATTVTTADSRDMAFVLTESMASAAVAPSTSADEDATDADPARCGDGDGKDDQRNGEQSAADAASAWHHHDNYDDDDDVR